MYVNKEIAKSMLNIKDSELKNYKSFNHIKYSETTDKYDPNSILEKRTMTIGIEKLLSEKDKEEIEEKMGRYASLKFKLFNDLQKGRADYSNSGKDREHREIGRKTYGFGNHISDSALSSAIGIVKSTEAWYKKRIVEIEKKIKARKKELEKYQETKDKKDYPVDYEKGKKQNIEYLEKRLKKYKEKSYIPIHFGKSAKTKEERKQKRLEYFSAGSAQCKGNPEIRFEYIKKLDDIKLKIFDKYYNIEIPKTHEKTFSLSNYNCQACRIAYNKKGKLVLHITYSYIKPIQQRNFIPTNGTIGIDIGPKEIAVCLVKKDGNPFKYIHFSTGNLLDKRTEETERELSLIIDKIIKTGEDYGYTDITIENLEFKEDYKYKSNKLNRMLKKFPYRKFEDLIRSKCFRKGINLRKVNPAYTSVIGIFKYSSRDNLSPKHNSKSHDLSAALAIGRRGLRFRERAVVCIKVSSMTKSVELKTLFQKSEKDGKKVKGRRCCNWVLWNQLKRGYTLEQLTALLFNPPKN